MAATMFERYGGFAKVSRMVSAFYDRVLESPVISHYFANTDMRRLIDHQTKFIASLMGGPASYTDEQLLRSHAHLKIDDRAFAELAALLTETLEDFDVADSDVTTVRNEIMARKKYIDTGS